MKTSYSWCHNQVINQQFYKIDLRNVFLCLSAAFATLFHNIINCLENKSPFSVADIVINAGRPLLLNRTQLTDPFNIFPGGY